MGLKYKHKTLLYVLRAVRYTLILILIFQLGNGQSQTTPQLTYIIGEVVDRDSVIQKWTVEQIKIVCAGNDYFIANYKDRWKIKDQLTSDERSCRLAKLLHPNEDFTTKAEHSTVPIIIPKLSGAFLFPRGPGVIRDLDLAKFNDEIIIKHCGRVLDLLMDYQPEYDILQQLQMDFSYCMNRGFSFQGEPYFSQDRIDPRSYVCPSTNTSTPTESPQVSSPLQDPTPSPAPNDFKLPWTNCRLLINEFNTNTPTGNLAQFLELMQACKDRASRNVALDGFWILIIDGKTRTIVVSKSLNGYSLKNVPNPGAQTVIRMFTIGSSIVHGIDLPLDDLPIAEDVDFGHFLPVGENSPYAVVLLHGKYEDLKNLNLPIIDNKYTSLPITDDRLNVIKNSLQDIVVYGSRPIYQRCTIFEDIYPAFADPASRDQYLIRDFQADPNAVDNSLNRCTRDFLPVLPKSFMHAIPTPSRPNDCKHAFPFNMQEHMFDISNLLEQTVGTVPGECSNALYSAQTYEEVQAERYQQVFLDAESTLAGNYEGVEIEVGTDDVEMEIERMDDQIRQVGQDPDLHDWQCHANNPFDFYKDWKTNILASQKDLLDITVIENCDVKPWFWYYLSATDPRKSKYGCKFCSDILNEGIATLNPGRIDEIMKPGGTLVDTGVDQKKRNSRKMTNHPKHPFHSVAVHHIMEKEWYKTKEELLVALEQPGNPIRKYYAATEEIIAAVYHAVKMNLSFMQYEQFMKFLLMKSKMELGIHYHDRKSMQRIADLIGEEMHKRLVLHLLTNKPLISIILDASQDIAGKHYLAVLFQTFDKNDRPHIFFYRLLQLGVSETGEAMFELLWNAFGEDGLQDYFKKYLRGYSSDGAAAVKSALFKLLKERINKNIVGMHCAAHRLDLVTAHAFKAFPFLLHLDDVINEQHNFLNGHSLKVREFLNEVIMDEDDSFFQLHALFPVRWISSKFNAIKNILNHWKTLIATYEKMQTDARFLPAQKARAEKIKSELISRPVLSSMAFLEDLCSLFKTFSLAFQRDRVTPIPIKKYKEIMHQELHNLILNSGTTESNLLEKVVCVKDGKLVKPCRLADYENKDVTVTYEGYELAFTENPMYPSLSSQRADYINALHGQLLGYFPDDIFDSFSVFYPKSIPLSHQPWNKYGEKELLELKAVFAWQWSDDLIIRDWTKLIESIVTKERTFMVKRELEVDNFWYYYRHDATNIEWTDVTKEIIATVENIPGGTASSERIFSLMNVVKPYRRSLLPPKTLENLIRIKYNGPDVEYVNLFHYAKTWCKDHSRADDTTRVSADDYKYRNEFKTIFDEPPTIF